MSSISGNYYFEVENQDRKVQYFLILSDAYINNLGKMFLINFQHYLSLKVVDY